MSLYIAPLRNIKFAMNEVLDFPSHYRELPTAEETMSDLVDAILSEAAKFSENVIAPLNTVGDLEGCKFDNGAVTTPKGFKEAYDSFVMNGWHSLSQDVEYGGQGLPSSLNSIVLEMLASANQAWEMYPALTWGAIKTLEAHGNSDLCRQFLPNLISGKWSGTMCLTESQAGSDLGLLRTKAIPNGDASYTIRGSKIFISAGDHDLTDNIIHIVLARLPDAPEGVKGISLFAVPKYKLNKDASLGEGNKVHCGSIEHKMGIHGNATCVINFDDSIGYMLGEPNKGMRAMFTFINESRLSVAQQAVANMEASFQTASSYARERLQMRAFRRMDPASAADPIIAHADVRRMLLTQKAFVEGGRLLNYFCAKQIDIVESHPQKAARDTADNLLGFLTPIAKGFLTEVSQEATSLGIQVLGGHGYLKEWGQEQRYRDTRITAIYEGTTGIQGLDLLVRKVLASKSKLLESFVSIIDGFCRQNADTYYAIALGDTVDQWKGISNELSLLTERNEEEANAAAFEYLMYSGYCVLAYFLAEGAVLADREIQSGSEEELYYKSKQTIAKFYFERILPRKDALKMAMLSGSANLANPDNVVYDV
ncbi:acyl-CoA dehydrogenase [Pseudomaricurvus alkylphenolicus]|uniref:acyl-CoA dehydrogenase family protein n=1 Tax=Pseudomaricurvus alkylphenolicus TaxID=1306991 RepID=UPI001423D2C5|nr:acyl-CoA dehydrogenase family protein [Pseudomaricurvus alkylphenolicus]NIB42250.1 acyl-CoA dehydrogenase [Pseudomaricurvus alkylphenolicus]